METRPSRPAVEPTPHVTGLHGGRPTLDPAGKASVTATIRVGRDELALWHVEAARRGYDMSAFARQCVRLVILKGLMREPVGPEEVIS